MKLCTMVYDNKLFSIVHKMNFFDDKYLKLKKSELIACIFLYTDIELNTRLGTVCVGVHALVL